MTRKQQPSGKADSCRLRLASPAEIREWSSGEVTLADIPTAGTDAPEKGGLFCETIFGPENAWECPCGVTKKDARHKDVPCRHCGGRVGAVRVRRKRMGHIELAAPVMHLWFRKAGPSRLGELLGMKASSLERVIAYQAYVVTNPRTLEGETIPGTTTTLRKMQVLTEEEHRFARDNFGDGFEAGTGAVAVRTLLRDLDLAGLARTLRAGLAGERRKERPSNERIRKAVRRLEVVEALRDSGGRPEWMVLECIPVIPPDLRPIVPLKDGRLASSDLNELYANVIRVNNRLKSFRDRGAPDTIVRDKKRQLQRAVDALFDNGRLAQPATRRGGTRPLKSLADELVGATGKEGRFRQNLLGKRVDYSARSVIVPGPRLQLHQCGLPRRIALELFKPFIIRAILESDLLEASPEQEKSTRQAIRLMGRMVRDGDPRLWRVLEQVAGGHVVLLNRAPTLHRMGIQAFEPVLCDGNAILLHPLACKAFNADFDGDQMAVHLPLSIEAQVEARVLMAPAANILSPAGGQPILAPSQDIVLGCSYLTRAATGAGGGRERAFSGPGEVVLAHSLGKVGLHDRIRVRLATGHEVVRLADRDAVDPSPGRPVSTTVGRVLFNEILPEGMPYYDRFMSAPALARVVSDCLERLGRRATIELLERVKALGFRFATLSGLSVSMDDLKPPPSKGAILSATDKAVDTLNAAYQRGDIQDGDRLRQIIDLWTDARDRITVDLLEAMAQGERPNPVLLMVESGARGGKEQLRQLAGMRGLISKPSGEVHESPIRSSFREGLSVPEYFASTHGARKGLTDTTLKTAEAGHLTRKLADVAHDVVVTERDCGTRNGLRKQAVLRDGKVEQTLAQAVRGRVCCEGVGDGGAGLLVGEGELITAEKARRLEEAGVEAVRVRSPLTCRAPRGVCRMCYGTDLSTGRLVEEGTAVGIIAAQSIGEPGTQLTMRTFHVGGVHTQADITRGLPRVVELFEARKADRPAVLAEAEGRVRLAERGERVRGKPVVFVRTQGSTEVAHILPAGRQLLVRAGEEVRQGQPLTEGPVASEDILRLCGVEAAADHLQREIMTVYRQQRVPLDDRHVEVILGRMLSWVRVISAGGTPLLPGDVLRRQAFDAVNASREEGPPATCRSVLLGIARAAARSESFLSAASFQETARVLTSAALAGKTDPLVGLKENVILGRLIPAGTGFRIDREAGVGRGVQPRASGRGSDAPASDESSSSAARATAELPVG